MFTLSTPEQNFARRFGRRRAGSATTATLIVSAGVLSVLAGAPARFAHAQQTPASPTSVAPPPTQPPTRLPAAPTSPAQDPLAGPIRKNDELDVAVVGDTKLSGKFRVDTDGNITMPMAGRIKLFGLQPFEAGNKVTQTLKSRQILRRPQVTVTISGRPVQTVSVSGAVVTQGRTNIKENTRLNEVLEPAGIQPGASDLARVVVTRTENNKTHDIVVDYGAYREGRANSEANNPILLDNDKVYVYSKAPVIEGTVRITGEVGTPSPAVPVAKGTTAVQAILLAGGVTPLADKDRIVVRRGGTEIAVPFKDVREGATEKDIVLQDKDEIFVTRRENDLPKQYSVIGAVPRPTQYPLERRISLQEAIALAGGTNDGAKDFAVELKRVDDKGLIQTRKYNLKRAEDATVEVLPNDIINVPPPSRNPQTFQSTLGVLSGLAGLFFFLRR